MADRKLPSYIRDISKGDGKIAYGIWLHNTVSANPCQRCIRADGHCWVGPDKIICARCAAWHQSAPKCGAGGVENLKTVRNDDGPESNLAAAAGDTEVAHKSLKRKVGYFLYGPGTSMILD